MTNFTNAYFEEMQNTGIAYEQAKAERRIEKEQILKSSDDAALERWYERENNFPYPFSRGQTTAFRAWKESIDHSADIFECNDLPWDKDTHDFVVTLREAGIKEFAVTDKSTALMEELHLLEAEGCRLVSLYKVSRVVQKPLKYLAYFSESIKEVRTMSKEGAIGIYGEPYHYWVKVYEIGSEYGIEGGKISKLMIKRNGQIVCNYDRGWDIKPVDEGTQLAYEILVHTENY